MENQRQVIGRLCAAGKTTRETKTLVREMYGPAALTLRQIQRIYAICAGLSAEDAAAALVDQRSVGNQRKRPARDERTVARVRDAVNADSRATVEDIAECAGAPSATAWRILTDELGLVKLEARWVPKDLTEDMKKKRVDLARLFLRHWAQWRYQIVTCDETYIEYDPPMTPRQRAEWRDAGDAPPESCCEKAWRKNPADCLLLRRRRHLLPLQQGERQRRALHRDAAPIAPENAPEEGSE